VRRATEEALKEGRLRAVVATASLELGIDMGAVDLVCQVESTGNVARALQRVGRAGHLVGQQSKGRLIPKTATDLLDQAVLAAEMAAGRVEELRVPTNCLDVLAQQIVATVAMDEWDVDALYRVVRQAYPYRDLTPAAFDAVLEMVSGRYRLGAAPDDSAGGPLPPGQQLAALQPRISWDRVHQRLQALPGSQRLALAGGGTIPDTGQYAVVTHQRLRVGEVDEEFVYERRVGEAFLLGTSAWRIDRIETDRVIVQPAEGAPAIVPFWRGENAGRSYDLGLAQGRFLDELAGRLDSPDCLDWLQTHYFLDAVSARNVRDLVRRQVRKSGGVPTDRRVFVEASRDPLGDWQVIVLCPLGGRFNLTLRFALENLLARRLGYRPQCLHHDDGVLIRLTESDEPVLDVLAGLTPDNLRELVLEELADSALFALRFRQNAARALLMPRGAVGKRAPLWLQRLRGRDLLQVARRYPDFPIVTETFRECLNDHLDVPRVQAWLAELAAGRIDVRAGRLEGPSPLAAGLLFAFTVAFMYQYDGVEANRDRRAGGLDEGLLDQLIAGDGQRLPLDPRAVGQVDRRLRGVGQPPRTAAETAEWVRRLGDVSPSDVEGATAEFLRELEADGRIQTIELPGAREPKRWVLTEEAGRYADAFAAEPADPELARQAAAVILGRFLDSHALVGLGDVLDRYPFDPAWARRQLEEWSRGGRLVPVPTPQAPEPLQWSAPDNFERMQRGTLSILRREVITCPAPQYADFVARWQHVHPATRLRGAEGVGDVLAQLQALRLPIGLWEASVLPARVRDYQASWLNEAVASGRWTWTCRGDGDREAADLAFFDREQLTTLPPWGATELPPGLPEAVLDALQRRGAQFTAELAGQLQTTTAAVRAALWSLLRLGLVTNDQVEIVRHPEPIADDAEPRFRSRREMVSFLKESRRRRERTIPEGRWSVLPWGRPDAEAAAFVQARLLLDRYGIVARELALLDGTMPAWRILYEVLSRLELAGEVRRGYFVEGLSGAQFALPEAARELQNLSLPAAPSAEPILLHSLDPANLYGIGAPLDLPLLAGGARGFSRRAGHWIVLQAGRPVLLVEQQGRRLTALASARAEDLARAVVLLPSVLTRAQQQDLRHKLTVETWNEQPVTATEGKELLERAGFVRDYQAMTLYSAWR
jgi:ATP-dependent Lhr-like helicase